MSKNFLKTEKIVKENMKTGNLDVIDDEKKVKYQEEKKASICRTILPESNHIRSVLGDEMFEFSKMNCEEIFKFNHLFRRSIAEFNYKQGIKDADGEKLLSAIECVGEEFFRCFGSKPITVIKTIVAFEPLLIKYGKIHERELLLKNYIEEIDSANKNVNVELVARALFGAKNVFAKDYCLQNVKTIKELEKVDLTNISDESWKQIRRVLFEVGEGLKTSLIKTINDIIHSSKRGYDILYRRACGESLEKIGEQYAVTKERIRQIELKYQEQFNKMNKHFRFIYLIAGMTNASNVVEFEAIDCIFGDDTKVVKYLLMRSDCDKYIYKETIKAFMLQDYNWFKKAIDMISKLPDVMTEEKLEEECFQIANQLGLSENYSVVLEYSKQTYHQYGSYYHKRRIDMKHAYIVTLEKFFATGIKVSGKNEYDKFRKNVSFLFGDIGMSKKKYKVVKKIKDIAILCAKDTYLLPIFIKISPDIINKITDFIVSSQRNHFTFSALYDEFKEILHKQSNVNNKYFLEGVLKYYLSEKFYFSKQLISKNKENASLKYSLEEYVEAEKKVSKKRIDWHFKGVSEEDLLMIIRKSKAITAIDIGWYISSKLIKYNEVEKVELYKLINSSVETTPVSTKKLLGILRKIQTKFLSKNAITDHIKLYGILEHLFSDRFQFSRPFIGKLKSGNIDTLSVIKQYLNGKEEFEISSLLDYCKDNFLEFQSIRMLLYKINSDFLRVDANVCVNTSKFKIDKTTINGIENLIGKLVDKKGYIATRSIKDYSIFPDIGYNWNGYLLESVLIRFSDKYQIIEIQINRITESKGIIVDSKIGVENNEELIKFAIKHKGISKKLGSVSELRNWLIKEGLISKSIPEKIARDIRSNAF